MMKLRRPSPALVVALVALFVSLSGTAVAAAPIAKRALFANNAGKLQGKTARQVAAIPGPATTLEGQRAEDLALMPSPATTASSLVSLASAPFALAPDEAKDISAQCPAGAKAVTGGFTTSTSGHPVFSLDMRPTADGSGWTLYLVNGSSVASATGSVQVVCLR